MMPKKWLIALSEQLDNEPDKHEQKKILIESAKELRELADHHGIDPDDLITAFGRKIG